MQQSHLDLSKQLTDLKQCEQEPVHFIGSVQAHGCLLCFTLPDRRIQAASENVGEFLGHPHKDIVSAKLEHVVDQDFADQVVKAIPELSNSPTSGINLRYKHGDVPLSAYIFETQGLYCLELEKIPAVQPNPEEVISDEAIIRNCTVQLRNSENLRQSAKAVCQAVRRVAGMDRVMLYRFIAPMYHGEVIAEDRNVNAHSYDLHRFPASDIPRTARDLYLRNGVRVIPDAKAPISKVSPGINPLTKSPLDLSDSRIRAVSPIHLEYLGNMNVRASYSFAIVVKGELWGLIACHSQSSLLIDTQKRTSCEIIANSFAAVAPLIEQVESQKGRIGFDSKLRQILDSVRFSADPVSDLFKSHQALFETFNVTGIAYVSKSITDMAGLCPSGQQLLDMASELKSKMGRENKSVLAIESLSGNFPEWHLNPIACGVLAVTTGDIEEGIFMLFRPEHIETIVWGGDPRKQLDKKGFTGRIHPRASFNAWEEKIQGHSREWLKYEIDGAVFLKEIVFETLALKQKLIQELTMSRSQR